MNEKLKFEFSVEEANTVLNALAQLPYTQVSALIDNIRTQAAPQVQPVEKVAAEPV
jgi:hypothetical protein